MQFNLKGFEATAIGSLPFLDMEKAMDLIEKHTPIIPHWPQLPKRGMQEHFVHQYLELLVRFDLLKIKEDKMYMDYEDNYWQDNLLKFYELYLSIEAGDIGLLEEIKTPIEYVPGIYDLVEKVESGRFVEAQIFKGQIAGPLSVGLNIKDHRGKLVYYDSQLRDLVVKTLMLQAWWQTLKLKINNKGVIVFVDDPALSAFGTSNYITLNREMIIEDLAFVIGGIRNGGGLAGAHSCAGIDWTILMEAGFNIISFDAYSYFQTLAVYTEELKTFINSGGLLAWGIIPTYNLTAGESVENLTEIMGKQIEHLLKKGINESKLLDQIMITPACGASTLTEETAEKVYQLLQGVSEAMQNKYVVRKT